MMILSLLTFCLVTVRTCAFLPFTSSNYINRLSRRPFSVFTEVSDKLDQKENVNELKTVNKGKLKTLPRTNRVDGQEKWIKELRYLYKNKNDTSEIQRGMGLIVELAKELYCSGIPEQVLELYAAYHDIILQPTVPTIGEDKEENEIGVVPDMRLIVVTTRAFLSLFDVQGALKLLQSCSRMGLKFDSPSKSELIAELATVSPSGLEAALKLRTSMLELNETVTYKGDVGILQGIWKHGLTPLGLPEARSLLVDSAAERKILMSENGDSFRLMPDEALSLAESIATPYLEPPQERRFTPQEKKRGLAVSCEFLRIVFRTSALKKKFSSVSSMSSTALAAELSGEDSSDPYHLYDIDFQVNEVHEQQIRALAGLRGAMRVMDEYGVEWNVRVADALISECLNAGDPKGVRFVVQQMWDHRIHSRTSTFNALLTRYAENGDGESAYHLVHDVMLKSNATRPDTETWVLLLTSCLKTTRGRYYGKLVVKNMLESNGLIPVEDEKTSSFINKLNIRKDIWDKILELDILNENSYEDTLRMMVLSNCQPDLKTIRQMFNAYYLLASSALDSKNPETVKETIEKAVNGAIKLYEKQMEAEKTRQSYRRQVMSNSDVSTSNESSQLENERSTEEGAIGKFLSQIRNQSFESKEDGVSNEADKIVYMSLPPPSVDSLLILLQLLRDMPPPLNETHRHFASAVKVLQDVFARALDQGPVPKKKAPPLKPLKKKRPSMEVEKEEEKEVILPVSQLVASGRQILQAQFSPDPSVFALVIETCLQQPIPESPTGLTKEQMMEKDSEQKLSLVLQLMQLMEEWGLKPDRRVYGSLIRAFGENNDVLGALGVFQEMRGFFVPDVASLQYLLDVCLRNPTELRQICGVLEDMAEDKNVELDVYCRDILMQGFGDALSLGVALEEMESVPPVEEGIECVTASLSVLSVLVQCCRTETGPAGLVNALRFLGSVGIRPDEETMEYFRIGPAPSRFSADSRHYHTKLLPRREKLRSILDIEFPSGLAPDLSLQKSGEIKAKVIKEPNFEIGGDKWEEYSKALQTTVLEKFPTFPDVEDENPDEDLSDVLLNNFQAQAKPVVSDILKELEMELPELTSLANEKGLILEKPDKASTKTNKVKQENNELKSDNLAVLLQSTYDPSIVKDMFKLKQKGKNNDSKKKTRGKKSNVSKPTAGSVENNPKDSKNTAKPNRRQRNKKRQVSKTE